MIWIVVEAGVVGFAASAHLTTIPFKLVLTESIDNVEIRGDSEAPGAEVLMNMNVEEFTTLCVI